MNFKQPEGHPTFSAGCTRRILAQLEILRSERSGFRNECEDDIPSREIQRQPYPRHLHFNNNILMVFTFSQLTELLPWEIFGTKGLQA